MGKIPKQRKRSSSKNRVGGTPLYIQSRRRWGRICFPIAAVVVFPRLETLIGIYPENSHIPARSLFHRLSSTTDNFSSYSSFLF